MADECAKILRELQLYLDGETSAPSAEVVAQHLSDCPPCLERAEFEQQLRAIVAAKCSDCAPPHLRERVLDRFLSP